MNLLYRSTRVLSVIVLAFFLWIFGGLFEITYAIKNDQQSAVSNQPSAFKNGKLQKQKPEEDFEKDVDDIYQALTDQKSYTETKRGRIRRKKGKLDLLDVEMRKKFNETEKFLKDKELPLEILDRHYRFVKHYDDNLKELRSNLDNIEKAKTKGEADNQIEKAKTHLEKGKPPKKHRLLDPNKLPHRTAEPVFVEPRTNPAEFTEGKKLRARSKAQKPVLVASNGSLDGMLTPNSEPSTSNLLLALANPPSPADLAETIEVQFTPEINAKAQELQYNPVKIYNWVRNNIEYVPTYGSIQGANMCLQTKLCNDFDTASLLIALLRASGIHARYAYGTIEVPIEKIRNWLGGFTDSMAAINLLASAGVPTKGMIDGGQVKYVRKEHIWVEAYIDYIPSRGARHKNGQGDTWIPLDASFKQYNYTKGIDVRSAVPFDGQSFINQIQSTATINETEGYVTNVNSLLIRQTMQDYQTGVQNYISQNYPNATVGDVLGKKEIIHQDFSYLLGTLPYRMIIKGATYTSIPDSLRHKITFNVTKDMYDDQLGTPINITKSLPELAGKKITLSYSPATTTDETVINLFLPNPHPDGTPIQPNELPTSLPAYLVNLKPELRIDGVAIATGTFIGMGNNEDFTMTFSGPGQNAHDIIPNEVKAGNYLGIALDLGRISQEQVITLKTKIEATKTKLAAQDFVGLTRDDILGDLLYVTALSYLTDVELMNCVTAKTMEVISITLPSETIFSFELKSNYSFGIPISVNSGGLAMDADRLITLVKALDGNEDKPVRFMLGIGANDSVLEHFVPEQAFSKPDDQAQGISAVKAIKLANDQGMRVFTINQSNIATIFPQLEVDSDTKVDIQNAVNTGKEVTVSQRNIDFNGWTGCGYIIIDPTTGAGAYMISGGMSGGIILAELFMTNPAMLISVLFLSMLANTINTVLDTLVEMIKIYLCAPNPILMIVGNYYVCKAFYGEEAALNYYKCLYDIVLGEMAEAVVDETITLTLIASLGLTVGKKIAKRISLAVNIVSSTDDIISYGKCNYRLIQ